MNVEKESYETLMSLSAAENVLGAHPEAIRDLQNATSSIEKVLAAQPHDTIVKFELANVNARLAQMLVDAREAETAIPHLDRAQALLQELLNADPANALFRRSQPIVENQLATALRSAGRVSDGVPHSEKALRLVEALTKDSPKSVQYRIDLGSTERIFSEGLLAEGNASEALQQAQRATLLLCDANSSSSDPSTVSSCGKALLASGNAFLALQDVSAAKSALQKAETIASAQSREDTKNVTLRSNAARAQAAYAAALAKGHDLRSAESMYEHALQNWSSLRQNNSITAEDLHRSNDATLALSALRSHR